MHCIICIHALQISLRIRHLQLTLWPWLCLLHKSRYKFGLRVFNFCQEFILPRDNDGVQYLKYMCMIHIVHFYKIHKYCNHLISNFHFSVISEAKSVATTYDCKFIETSTVLNHNVDELLAGILSQIRLKQKQNQVKSKLEHIQGCVAKSKTLLNKLFKKEPMSKSCENLYTLWRSCRMMNFRLFVLGEGYFIKFWKFWLKDIYFV